MFLSSSFNKYSHTHYQNKQKPTTKTGSTDTSLWTHYNAGAREYCGNAFPDGMAKNDRLAANVLTPTTKAEDHDEPISAAEILERGLMSAADWEAVSRAALALFEFGQAEAAKRGLLLVDTKYEFGKDAAGNVLLIDEVCFDVCLVCFVLLSGRRSLPHTTF